MTSKNKLLTEKVSDGRYKVFFESKYLGDFVRDVDGFFYYWPSEDGGCWSAWTLRLIANELEELNADWNKYIDENLKE